MQNLQLARRERATRSQPQYESHLLIPRMPSEKSGRALLLALVIEPAERCADNLPGLAQRLGTRPNTVKGWRTALLSDGLIRREGGYLVPDGYGLLRWQDKHGRQFFDHLPMRLLHRVDIPPLMKRALAHQHSEGIGARAQKDRVSSDHEREKDSGIGRKLFPRARALLKAEGIGYTKKVSVKFWQGCRTLHRYRLNHDRLRHLGSCWTGEDRAAELAKRAERGRKKVRPEPFQPAEKRPAEERPSPIEPLRGSTHIAAKPERPSMELSAHCPDGLASNRPPSNLTQGPDTEPGPDHQAGRVSEGPKSSVSTSPAASERTGERVLRELGQDPDRIRKLAKRSDKWVVDQILALTGLYQPERRLRHNLKAVERHGAKRMGWAGRIVQRYGNDAVELVLRMVVDVASGPKVRNMAAVLKRNRLPDLVFGRAEDAFSSRAPKDLDEVLERVSAFTIGENSGATSGSTEDQPPAVRSAHTTEIANVLGLAQQSMGGSA